MVHRCGDMLINPPRSGRGHLRADPRRRGARRAVGTRAAAGAAPDAQPPRKTSGRSPQWNEPADTLDRLVKASTRPNPGAFTFRSGDKLRVWRSKLERDCRIRGERAGSLRSCDETRCCGISLLSTVTTVSPSMAAVDLDAVDHPRHAADQSIAAPRPDPANPSYHATL